MNPSPGGIAISVANTTSSPGIVQQTAIPEGVSHLPEQLLTMNKLPGQDGVAMVGVTSSSPIIGIQQPQPVTLRQPLPSTIPGSTPQTETKVLDKRRIQELVKEVDPMEQLDEEVEDVLLNIADDFIDSVVTSACQIAKHRKSNTLEVKDVQLHLERNWNMWIPGFGSDELRPYKKSVSTEAHKQRMALIRKTLKKY